MFDFGNANDSQRRAISTTEGPVLIIAGPGTGKTYTLVQRTIYLIEEKGVKPEEIFIATFTEKAAKELITRITNELFIRNISVNINEMYIGTFHSLCLRIIKKYMEYTQLNKNYRLLDSIDQQYIVFREIDRFMNIYDIKNKTNEWYQYICELSNILTEELVDIEKMELDTDVEISKHAKLVKEYKLILSEKNLIDFSSIQKECFTLLRENENILKEIRNSIKYIMVDEYQDTNYVQEQIVFLLGSHNNICVVGDDDQSLYRFRGATIRNILEFTSKFKEVKCEKITLSMNYRSNSDIIDFYNKWMTTKDVSKFKLHKYRHIKEIEPYKKTKINSTCVVKLSGKDDQDEWHKKILEFINKLKDSGKIQDFNQLAFLFKSVSDKHVISLANFLERNHIHVYSPRSNMFFRREEVMKVLGCMILIIPKFRNHVEYLEKRRDEYPDDLSSYYMDCVKFSKNLIEEPKNIELKRFIQSHSEKHNTIDRRTDSYLGLLYRLFMYKPFCDILDTDTDVGIIESRAVRNLAKLTQILEKFEYFQNIDVLNNKSLPYNTVKMFNIYLNFLFGSGIGEYEDKEEYAPSGCVSFFTIHQSKGMEFPIVFVDSLDNIPRKTYKEIFKKVEGKYYDRKAFEPYDEIKYFDFWRLYYTAFSRAQDLLVLTCDENKKIPSKYFKKVYNELPMEDTINLEEFNFNIVKSVNLKSRFSFTSHITVYETCALQYKFYKEFEFMPVKQGGMLFGTLVHETIGDIHRAVLRNETEKITKENILRWLKNNRISLIKKEGIDLSERYIEVALKQILRYVEIQNGEWSTIQQAEVDVSLVRSDYIIEGKIDLVKFKNGTIELVDFKTEKKPDNINMKERLERYKRQLYIYAYLIEQRTGQKVSKMHLYYTGEENENPIISFEYIKSDIDRIVAEFDDTVHKILKKDFKRSSKDDKICSNCDFKYYCMGKK